MSEPNPFEQNQAAPQNRPRVVATGSGWATTCLVLSILGPVFSCLCIPTILFALGGIFTGHKARGQIMASNGMKTGIGKATAGLVISYTSLIVCLVLLPGWIKGFRDAVDRGPVPVDARSEGLREAESMIRSDTNGIANGNSPLAVDLAQRFADAMKEIREEGFEAAEDGVDTTDGRFLTYCELHDDSCLFLTQAPMLRKFADDAKDSLGDISWEVAQALTAEVLEPDAKLGVGMKGMLLYGQIRVGQQSDSAPINSDDKELLLQFFERNESPNDSMDDLESLIDEALEVEIEVGEGSEGLPATEE